MSTAVNSSAPVPASGPQINAEWAGILIYLIGTISMALGAALQKTGFNKREADAPEKRRHLCCYGIWVVGVVIYSASGALYAASLIFASMATVGPLMSFLLVSNMLCAALLLKETVFWRDLCAITVIVIGIILVELFSPNEDGLTYRSQDELIALYQAPTFLAYILVFAGVAGSMIFTNLFLTRRLKQDPLGIPDWEISLLGFTFGCIAGCFGGFCNMMMSSAIQVISSGISSDGWATFGQWLVWVLIISLVTSWILQMFFINWGLAHAPAIFIISLEAVFNELFTILGGMLYFQEYRGYSTTSLSVFVVGVFLSLLGVFVIATRPQMINVHDETGRNLLEQRMVKGTKGEQELASETRGGGGGGGSTKGGYGQLGNDVEHGLSKEGGGGTGGSRSMELVTMRACTSFEVSAAAAAASARARGGSGESFELVSEGETRDVDERGRRSGALASQRDSPEEEGEDTGRAREKAENDKTPKPLTSNSATNSSYRGEAESPPAATVDPFSFMPSWWNAPVPLLAVATALSAAIWHACTCRWHEASESARLLCSKELYRTSGDDATVVIAVSPEVRSGSRESGGSATSGTNSTSGTGSQSPGPLLHSNVGGRGGEGEGVFAIGDVDDVNHGNSDDNNDNGNGENTGDSRSCPPRAPRAFTIGGTVPRSVSSSSSSSSSSSTAQAAIQRGARLSRASSSSPASVLHRPRLLHSVSASVRTRALRDMDP